jgi:UDP-N-acetyl-D-galactosamine dehydrogenase
MKISVIGLGYVGLPLAVSLAEKFEVTGFDISSYRVNELLQNHDRTGEICADDLQKSTINITNNIEHIKNSDIFIVTVPTPVDEDHQPDLSPLISASRSIAPFIKAGSIIVYESTVYPGVTEDVCGPELERHSGLKCGEDFFLGYSPERINPGDKKHTIKNIVKIVSAQNDKTLKTLTAIYGTLNNDQIFAASSIKVAEAAKVIENAQRDINIAFINEITQIFGRIGISVHDVLEAAKTKWNFLSFSPGLVGGHCIGVDPFYLAQCSMKAGHYPRIILSGREINDSMAHYIAKSFKDKMVANGIMPGSKVMVMGFTFKEDVPDLRNTKIIDLIEALNKYGYDVTVCDSCADPKEASAIYNIDMIQSLDCEDDSYDAILLAVPHEPYKNLAPSAIERAVKRGGVIGDIKGAWSKDGFSEKCHYWSL